MVSPGPLLAFLAGILSFLSPCVLPLVPSYLSYLSGLEPEQLRQAPTSRVRRQVLWHALAFIAGFSMIFVVLGATTSLLGRLFITHRSLVQKIGGALLV
ncbi:MAG: cytochrome c biogenesis protein CcdA, partial [Deinococcus sp.]|nr:cytochrome c biogenesis protein CcdA [Deinococcus sp.]